MKHFYDRKIKGFVEKDHYDKNKDSCVEINNEYFKQLFSGQENGKEIAPDSEGYPVLIDRPKIDAKQYLKRLSVLSNQYLLGGVKAYGAWIATDPTSRSMYNALAGNVPKNFKIPSLDGKMVPVDNAKIDQILELIKDLDIKTYLNLSKLQSELIGSSSLEDIDLYSGWPAQYIEGA